MTQKSPTCKTCGQPLVQSVKEIAERLQIPEHKAAQLYDYLVEKIWPEKLADAEPAKDERPAATSPRLGGREEAK